MTFDGSPQDDPRWTIAEVTAHHKTRALHTVVTDVVVWRSFHKDRWTERLQVLLIQRKHEPFSGCWALPGGFVEPGETCKKAAKRELEEETGLVASLWAPMYLVGVYDTPGRDPRGPNIGIAYALQHDPNMGDPKAADDATELAWFFVETLPPLAFDHADIIDHAIRDIEL